MSVVPKLCHREIKTDLMRTSCAVVCASARSSPTTGRRATCASMVCSTRVFSAVMCASWLTQCTSGPWPPLRARRHRHQSEPGLLHQHLHPRALRALRVARAKAASSSTVVVV